MNKATYLILDQGLRSSLYSLTSLSIIRKMAATEDMEAQLMAKYAALKDQGTPLERLRAHTMAKGIKGIRTIGRYIAKLFFVFEM